MVLRLVKVGWGCFLPHVHSIDDRGGESRWLVPLARLSHGADGDAHHQLVSNVGGVLLLYNGEVGVNEL